MFEYVIVMLAHGKTFKQFLSDLDAFLGDKAEKFTHWLWKHLKEHRASYTDAAAFLTHVRTLHTML